ncbi:RNA polymerase sigma-70 factor [Aliifodinibius sp. S!AR15-10]|uniref:RNA polymerase sigma-70 factor n=1 Tax=Aliifodinibius sp. S!AR15-10 TaxID=2950437 RepID=UPI0028652384|nr:RNA polymerase sigma-70 factor [Aliifodinibius sp. S!AR15-10]MDR8394529.1 RNA polymerase sigma-70 factor [Aliifodinibius sp. S!AR15-10]
MADAAYQKGFLNDSEDGSQREGFETFFRLFYVDLCKYAYGYTGDREISKDIVQSVFLKVWEQKAFWDDFESAKCYLYKSVRNESLNYKKHEKVKRENRTEVALRIEEWQDACHQEGMIDQKVELVQKGVSHLPDRCREIFKLSRESGLTYQEIAEVLDLSIKTVETQMGRALKSLRAFLKEHWNQVVLFLIFLFPF